MNSSTHIIEKVFLEVNTSKLETAHALKNNIGGFLKNELLPKLELFFDEFELNETVVRFDEIKLNLSVNGRADFNGIKYEIEKQVEDKLKRYVRPLLSGPQFSGQNVELFNSALNRQGIQRISGMKNQEDTFLFFLENGYLPLFGKEVQLSSLTEKEKWQSSLENPVFLEKLKTVFVREKTAVNRLINQFPGEIAVAFLAKINPKLHGHKKQISNFLSQNEPVLNQHFLMLLFQVSLNPENWGEVKIESVLKIVKHIHEILPDKKLQDPQVLEKVKILGTKYLEREMLIAALSEIGQNIKTEFLPEEHQLHQDEEPPFLEKESKGIAIQNAGLIVLHPFLTHFFKNVGITDKHGKLTNEKLALAVQSLHFLATGNEDVFEGNLVLEKFLCGIPLKMPLEKQSQLTQEIKAEAEVLLREAIKRWPALKNTSPDGLRQMFLQRDGKLIKNDTGYKIIVERKAQDVLLDELSWNISMVKLPWKKELLFVEW